MINVRDGSGIACTFLAVIWRVDDNDNVASTITICASPVGRAGTYKQGRRGRRDISGQPNVEVKC